MRQKLVIKIELPTFNDIIEDSKKHWSRYSKPKKKYDTIIAAYAKQQLKPIKYRVDIYITWYCSNKRTDKDNISAGGTKYLLDGLVKAGILKSDGWKNIGDIHHSFKIDKRKPRIEVIVAKNIDKYS